MAGMTATCVLTAFLITVVAGLPSTLLVDAIKAAESEPSTSKVKKAQEVMLFGNQQNRPSADKFYPTTHKQASSKLDKDEELPTAVPLATSSTSKTWEDGNKNGHQEQYSNDGKATGQSNIHNTGHKNTQHHQEQNHGDLANQQDYQSRGKTVSQYEKGYQYGVGKAAHDKHVENALLKSELYGDPGAMNQYRYYGGSNERKRNQRLTYTPPTKRSYRPDIPFVLPTDDLTSSTARLKRDLGLDPEDVLTLLSLWKAEHRVTNDNNPSMDPSCLNYYGLDIPRSFGEDERNEEVEDDDGDASQTDGGWLEGPVANPSTTPHQYWLERHGGYHYPILPTAQQYPLYPAQKTDSSQWGGFTKDKRFMVSRKRQVTSPHDGVMTLAQLLDIPYRDPGVPMYRHVVL
ncbi:prohormone-2-like isoform X2 [Zootermopsis nevadensis]|uniref:prohormone-2-like isoform X2 n=1 Tax=Zootermopsis nevadensis TaxID=136037 RepID=UPI000B8EB3A6|nr:prohormone-2-like isoform X2 [Zootermopsis nevadensis]